ncbi:transcriptional regulator NanR [Tropicibacter naphthalenivorans]|uniref:L-lactate utilization operon repressor n=1 Tax=Tropicibacter naphthalenivorans TaxID=441103 RepID=A0A0P1GGZ4_9RHOB|nr:transcriptional regulator NanR [Tropicibacter naphthalenivorans]CUH74932.1 L-lactate utilization operon repressor [Tropicibacter naphthalenivorans]SMC47953.1 transcriptional regulator, GntR family [Tropicibacter naphthalenivorans]
MTKTDEKITRRKLSDQVLDRLREMLASGELQPGDAMPSERVLMERFGVGRPAVREALQALHNNGLITINHGERSRVNAIDAATVLTQSDELARLVLTAAPANLGHLKDARRMFELGMVRQAAERATPDDVDALRAILAEQREMLGDADAFVEADMRFHTRIAQISANPIIASVSQAMLGWLFEYHTTLLHWSGNEDTTLAEHARIIELIAAHDSDGAVAAMAGHLDRSAEAFEPR